VSHAIITKLQAFQVIKICEVARQFLDENMFIVCADELDAVKSRLLEEGDEIKIRQKAGSFQLTAHKNGYYMNLKFSVTDDYPQSNVKSVQLCREFVLNFLIIV
jgi:hypothetical protein